MCRGGYRAIGPIATSTSGLALSDKGAIVSMGMGKIVVEYFSAAISRVSGDSAVWTGQLVRISGLSKQGSVDARIERECNQLPKKTHGRGQEIRHRDRCLVENPAQHF